MLDHDLDTSECLASCIDCHRACLAAAGDGLAAAADPTHLVRTLVDCAQMCQTAADFMLRRSDLHGYVCGLCAHVCKVCADRCETSGDPRLASCGATCHRCADLCLRMSKQAAHEVLV